MQNRNTAAAGGEQGGGSLSGDAVEAVLVAELGDALVTRSADIDPRYFTAYNEPAGARARALVRPRSVDDVSRTLALCARLGQPVVPQGGLTGLARGAVALGGEVVLSMERFAGIEALDAAAGTMTVRAGTPLQTGSRGSGGFHVRRRSRRTRLMPDRRHARDQCGRHARDPLRMMREQVLGRGGARGRHGRVVDEPDAEEQCGLRPQAAVHRQRRDARRRHARGAAAASAAGRAGHLPRARLRRGGRAVEPHAHVAGGRQFRGDVAGVLRLRRASYAGCFGAVRRRRWLRDPDRMRDRRAGRRCAPALETGLAAGFDAETVEDAVLATSGGRRATCGRCAKDSRSTRCRSSSTST